jgi:hypothetical protein
VKDNFGMFLHVQDPDLPESPLDEVVHKLYVAFREDLEDGIIQEIIEEAKAEGITDMAILNKPAIIDALKKQTAMKPIGEKYFKKCPSCNRGIGVEFGKPGFCDKCGQKLDWSEDDD